MFKYFIRIGNHVEDLFTFFYSHKNVYFTILGNQKLRKKNKC